MNTSTQTYTKTDIRKAFENFQADLLMLALRTQAMELSRANECAYDILLMAKEKCLEYIHIRLYNCYEKLVRVHKYSVKENMLLNSQRPGGNRWPCLPDGKLHILIEYSDHNKAKKLKESGRLKRDWCPTSSSTDYSGMQEESSRFYSSNGYGLQRDTFVNL